VTQQNIDNQPLWKSQGYMIKPGPISSGTLRTEDLIDAVMAEIRYVHQDVADPRGNIDLGAWPTEFRKVYQEAEKITDHESEEAEYILEDLIEKLNELAPPHLWLGSHPDDPACFGWWYEDPKEWWCDKVTIRDGESFVDTDCEIYVEINDHGNVTVKHLGGDVIWDCV